MMDVTSATRTTIVYVVVLSTPRRKPARGDDHLDDAAGVHAGAQSDALPAAEPAEPGAGVSTCELAEDRGKHDDHGRQGDHGPGKHRDVNAQSGGRQEERCEDGQDQRAQRSQLPLGDA